MGRSSKIRALPPELIDEINGLLIRNGFTGYDAVVNWLRDEKGVDISRSALHRHGSALEAEFEDAMADARRTRALARAARQEGGEQDNAMLEAATEIMQDNLLRVSLRMKNEEDPTAAAKTLSLVARAFADVGRFDLARQKWQAELNAKAADVADKAARLASKGGMSPDAAAEIRKMILGIAA